MTINRRLSADDVRKLVTAYVARYASAETGGDNSSLWVFEEVSALTLKQPADAFTFIVEALKQELSDFCMANLAAGPLEDLLALHGGTVIDWVEIEAKRNPAFDDLLGGVSLGRLSPPTAERVAAVRSAVWKD